MNTGGIRIMDRNKITFKENDGLYLDGVRINFMSDYKIESFAQGVSRLRITLLVDDSDMFKKDLQYYLDNALSGNDND